MRVTSSRLSDGREIRYYDPKGSPPRVAVDDRGLAPGSTEQGRMRRDALTGQWIPIAGHRQSRIFLPSAAECPLCPSRRGHLSEIPESSYNVVAFENRFPSFLLNPASTPDGLPEGLGLGEGMEFPAHGRCEVVTFSDDHEGSLGSLGSDRMALVMAAWQDRSIDLRSTPGIKYVFVFENRGADVGVTLHHPHGQIYAYPFVPPAAALIAGQAQRHFDDTGGRILLDDVRDFELAEGSRVIHVDDHWLAFVPYAARWPFEVQVHSRRGLTCLDELEEQDIATFSGFYPRLISALDRIFATPMPYMSGWLQKPAGASAAEERDSRLFLRLISNRRAADKLKYLAGSESLMGAFINDVMPEQAATLIRDALQDVP